MMIEHLDQVDQVIHWYDKATRQGSPVGLVQPMHPILSRRQHRFLGCDISVTAVDPDEGNSA